MEHFLSLMTGSIGGAVLVWLAKGWISERLKQSIQHEYAEKLESYKTELNSKIEGIRHENQVSQLRTSLFFDHQRSAFASLIAKIAQNNRAWAALDDPDEGLNEPVPATGRKEFEALLLEHQLFLDEECLMALSLVTQAYFRSFPYDDRSGEPPHQPECSRMLADIEYLQPRIASIFREKIGVTANPQHLVDVAILSAMELVNGYHFTDAGIPPDGKLSTVRIRDAADKVSVGLANAQELVSLLRQFDTYLSRDSGWFHEAQLSVKRTLSVLDRCIAKPAG